MLSDALLHLIAEQKDGKRNPLFLMMDSGARGNKSQLKQLGALRGLMANELVASGLRTKHLQLIRLIWTRNGMGEQYYRVLTPDMPYIKFEARVTEILCQGADEGWVTFVLPSSPSSDESTYRLEFQDEARFIAELEKIGTELE